MLVPAEPERPDYAYERTEVRDRVRGAIETLPLRERRVIALYYYGEVTMKEIGAELGVNESRVSQLHARALRRLREALGAEMTPAAACRRIRTAILAFAQKPKMAKAGLRPRREQPAPLGRPPRQAGAEQCRRLRQRVARGAQQVAQPKWLGQPAAAGFFEEPFGVGARDRAGDEDDASRQRRRRRRHRAIELHPVDPGHLQIADDQIVGALGRARVSPSSPSPARSTTKPASASASDTAAASAGSSSTTSTRQTLERLERRLAAAPACAAACGSPATGSSTKNDAPSPGLRRQPDASAVLLHDARTPRSARARCPLPTSFVVKNGSKIFPCTSSAMPGPSSFTSKTTDSRSASCHVRTISVPRPLAGHHRLLGVDDEIQRICLT